MPSPFQQKTLVRKVLYIGLIVVLAMVSGIYREYFVEVSAKNLSLLEQNVGEVEVGASALRLMLTGSRGFVVCALWYWAMDAQKKNRWNELDLYVQSVTQLQPHYIHPWLFQSWNLAYNVAVEADQVKDKYFYVSRGAQLLAKGERQNHNYPDLRFNIGLYQQHKICQSDETNVFRCLWQMSCMLPSERDPSRFWQEDARGHKDLKREEFEDFCKKHPQFVRRLREKLHYTRAEEVVQFLEDNRKIPSLYAETKDESLPVLDRFPILPERQKHPGELSFDRLDLLTDEFDAYTAARAWYSYAQEPLPPTDPKRPGMAQPITDRVHQHMPQMTVAIFRNWPARAQSYIGERLEEEGWFDTEGWPINDWFGSGEVRVGSGRRWAQEAWEAARQRWEQQGGESLLYLNPIEEAEKRELARQYMEGEGLKIGDPPPEMANIKETDPKYQGYMAARFMFGYNAFRQMTNLPHHLNRSLMESKPEVIQARKTFFKAEQNRLQARRLEALEQYESDAGLKAWRHLLETNDTFRNDQLIQEDSYEIYLKYAKILQAVRGKRIKRLAGVVESCLAAVGTHPVSGPDWPKLVFLLQEKNLPELELQPGSEYSFDVVGKDGKPLINDSAKYVVLSRLRPGQRPRLSSAAHTAEPGKPANR